MSEIETRDFPTRVIASLTCGIMLCEFGLMHEAAEFVMGHPIWTHHFADRTLAGEMKKTILAQCPGMPTDAPGIDGSNWQAFAEKIERELGKTVKIGKGGGLTAMLPTDGIPDHLKDSVIVIDASKGGAS